MKRYSLALTALLLCAYSTAQPLEQRTITLKSGDQKSINAPVSLPYDGEVPEGIIRAIQEGTGRSAPATIRNGEFVFVPEGAMPKQTLSYTIELYKREAAPAPHVRVEKQANADIVDVFIDDELLTSYHYGTQWKKPFLFPINTEAGAELMREVPMDPATQPKDHPHHKGIWTAHGDVNGADCWDEGPNSGYQHTEEVTFGSGNAYGWIHAKNTWLNKEKQPVVNEEREYRFYATPSSGRLIDESITFTAAYGDAKFGDTKEGGLVAYRMRPELCEKGGTGIITNADGDQHEDTVWGKPSNWCDYSGTLENVGWRGIAVFDNPGNLRHPTSWHARNYGLNGANCFGYSYFSEKEYNKPLMPANGDHLLKSGDKMTFNYRIYLHTGDVKEAAVADRYEDYVSPPKAEWAK